MKNTRLTFALKISILIVSFSFSILAQNGEKLKNVEQNKKSQVNSESGRNLELENTSWVVVKIRGDNSLAELKRPVYVVFNKKNNFVSTEGLCNGAGGKYKSDEGKNNLVISLSRSTIMGCQPENQIEGALSKSYRTVNRYKISGKNLYLYRGRTVLVTLVAEEK